jgi:hypothetical protein
MAKNTVVIIREGRTFEATACPDFEGAMVHYFIDEVVRPNWKIFRTRSIRSGCFWVSDFATILEGLENGLGKALEEEKEWEENQKKFKEFEKMC